MIKPQYVRDICDVYTAMYNSPGDEKPLVLQEEALDVEKTPTWKKVLQRETKKQNRKPPYVTHVEPREDASEEEEHPNKDVGVGSDMVTRYLDGLEKNKALDSSGSSADDQAQKYLETIINEVPTAVGGVNIHSVIKKAFIAGANAA